MSPIAHCEHHYRPDLCPHCLRAQIDIQRDAAEHWQGVSIAADQQLAGAVDALRWALGFIEYQGEPSPLDDPREGEADAESYRRALAIVGGQ